MAPGQAAEKQARASDGWAMPEVCVEIVPPAPARPERLPPGYRQVLDEVYSTSPELGAARQQLAARETLRAQAFAAFLPTLKVVGSIGYDDYRTKQGRNTDALDYGQNSNSQSIQLQQNLFSSGSNLAQLKRAENVIYSQCASYLDSEQSVLLQAVQTALDVARDREIVTLRERNLELLRRQLRAVQLQLERGDRTSADVAQAQSRVAQEEASLASARSSLNTSIGQLAQLMGRKPPILTLPRSDDRRVPDGPALMTTALLQDPAVAASRYLSHAAENELRAVQGQLGPTIDASASYGRTTQDPDIDALRQNQTNLSLRLQLTMPLYQGGAVVARIREARANLRKSEEDLLTQERRTGQAVTAAVESLIASNAQVVSLQEAVRASGIAVAGLQREAELGQRSVLDILDQIRELVNSQIALVQAYRDQSAASFALDRAVGRLTAAALGLSDTQP